MASDKLNKILQLLLINPIVSSYTDSSYGWQVDKYKNGIMIAVKKFTYQPNSITLTPITGGSYGVIYNNYLPSGFLDTPTIFVTPSCDVNYFLSMVATYITTSKFDLALGRHFAASIASKIYCNAMAVGKWKW